MEAIRLIVVYFSTPCRVVDRLSVPEVIIAVREVEQEAIIFP